MVARDRLGEDIKSSNNLVQEARVDLRLMLLGLLGKNPGWFFLEAFFLLWRGGSMELVAPGLTSGWKLLISW